MIKTLFIQKDTYRQLKWLNQFTAKTTASRRRTNIRLEHIYVIGASLVAADGFVMGRIDIPAALKEYCKSKPAFDILKLTTNPYLAILEDVKESKSVAPEDSLADMVDKLLGFIKGTKKSTEEGNRISSINRNFLKMLGTMPGGTDKLDIYAIDPTQPITVVSQNALSIIMPMHKDG